MKEKDIYSSLSELMSELLNLKNIQDKSPKVKPYSNKYSEIYEKVLSLKATNEKENEFKQMNILFIEKLLKKELNIESKVKEIIQKNININPTINKINDKIIQKNNKIYLEIDKLIVSNIHIHLFKNLEEIYQTKDSKKISDIKEFINDAYNKFLSINKEMSNAITDEIYFNKYFTLLYSIYPFFSNKQKESILNLVLSKEIKNILPYKQLLYTLFENEEDSGLSINILDLLISCFTNDKKYEKLDALNKIIFKISPNNKQILYQIYFFCLLYKKIYKNRDSFYTNIKLLSFKMHFILTNYKLFSFSTDEFAEIYQYLLFMKKFYISIYNKEIKEPHLIKLLNNELIYNNKPSHNDYNNISILFNNKTNENYEKIMSLNNGIIPHFYFIKNSRIKDIIDYSSYYMKKEKENFLYNLISLMNLKHNFIEKNFVTYKKNLINLEKEIYELAQRNLISGKNSKIIKNYIIKTEYTNIFNKFIEKLNEHLYKSHNDKYITLFKLYPMGSMTQFLSLDESDFDLYLYIENENKRAEIIEAIFISLKYFCKVEKIISQRLCLLKVEWKIENKNESFDLSILGFSPYVHSILFREYSLIDPRFPMVGLAVKYIKDILCLDKNFFLNSFCWMSLLVNFLQDIIYPPILPKLYSDKNGNIIYKDVEFGKNKTKNGFVNKVNFKNFIIHLNKEKIPISDIIFDKNKIRKIYNKNISKNKNKLSCAEILLKFIEFIAFYFKFDTIYSEISIEREGFFNLNEIKDLVNDKSQNDYDIIKYNNDFYNYFTKKYLKSKFYNKKVRDGFILIRDPLDNHYNPGQKFKDERNLDVFIDQLRFSYSILISHGSFEILKEKIREKIKQRMNQENN